MESSSSEQGKGVCPHLKRELEPPPRYMEHLPRDERGYPVPWFVAWVDGKPEFRAMDAQKFRHALRFRSCWVCGRTMGSRMCFVAGPMCGVNRTSGEPPSHVRCAQWSARNCPFLSNPSMRRRQDEQINDETLRENAAGIAIARNPGVAMLWVTGSYEVFPDRQNRPLIAMGEPERVEWWAHGRPATRAEVQAAIDSGLPALEALARQEVGGIAELQRMVRRLDKWLPVEA